MTGFDVTRDTPVCSACDRAATRRWTCRGCGIVVCDHKAGQMYIDGGCRCKPCHREYNSVAAFNVRLRRLELTPVVTPPVSHDE